MGATDRVRRWLPPTIAAAVLVVHVTLMYRAALRYTGGAISYPVDDAFIHLSIAKHVAFDGVFSVSGPTFTGASSSIGWPLLLALAMKIAGPNAALSLYLNLAFGVAVPYVVNWAALKLAPSVGPVARTLIALAVVVLTPLPTIVVLGMEHSAHIVFHIAFVAAAAVWLLQEKDEGVRRVAILAALTTLWRYEGIFPIFIVCAIAALRRRWTSAAIIAAAGAAVPVLFGIYSKAQGSLFLPIPVVLKGRHFDWSQLSSILGVDLMDRFGTEAAVLVVAVGCTMLAFHLRTKVWTPQFVVLAITLGVFILHLELASLGWFYRYESYLLASGIAFGGIALAGEAPAWSELKTTMRTAPARVLFVLLAMALLAMPLRTRALRANDDTPLACRNVFDQQGKDGKFLSRFKEPVAINDIGAVAWQGDEPIVDLVGLANLSVAKAKGLKLDQPLLRSDLARFTKDASVALIYDEWFSDGLPGNWLRVGRWYIDNNRSAAFPAVSIYALKPDAYPEIIASLRAFAPELPKRILQTGRYLDHPADKDRVSPGDELILGSSDPLSVGTHVVDDNGVLPLMNIGPVFLWGRSMDEAAAQVAEVQKRAGAPPGVAPLHAPVTILKRMPTPKARVFVAGNVPRSVITSATNAADALAAAGAAPNAATYVWREGPNGFEKLTTNDFVNGDIVVVLP